MFRLCFIDINIKTIFALEVLILHWRFFLDFTLESKIYACNMIAIIVNADLLAVNIWWMTSLQVSKTLFLGPWLLQCPWFCWQLCWSLNWDSASCCSQTCPCWSLNVYRSNFLDLNVYKQLFIINIVPCFEVHVDKQLSFLALTKLHLLSFTSNNLADAWLCVNGLWPQPS